MKRLLILICLFSIGLVHAQQVYRTVNEDGSVEFSDEPKKGSVEVEVKDLETVESLGSPVSNRSVSSKQEQPQYYDNIEITSPEDDQTIRDNTGNVSVTVAVQPRLRGAHKLILYMDGKEYSSGSSTSFQLENLDRGTHQLRAAVVDANSRQLIGSKSVSFHLHRHSILHPKPAKPK